MNITVNPLRNKNEIAYKFLYKNIMNKMFYAWKSYIDNQDVYYKYKIRKIKLNIVELLLKCFINIIILKKFKDIIV